MLKIAKTARVLVLLASLLACNIDLTVVTPIPGSNPPIGAVPTIVTPASGPALPPNLIPAQVINIVDGDTIDVMIGGTVTERVRLIGIDTPESGVCYFNEATNRTRNLVSGGQVLLEADVTQDDRDVYSRLLRFVWLPDGTLVNYVLVREGYAFEYTYRVPYKYSSLFIQAGADAQREGQGLWNAATCNGQAGRRN
jgi:micrococcal nuclease